MKDIDIKNGAVTAPQGFMASGVAAGIKKAGLDMALIVSDMPAVVAAVFTSNKVQAAPVLLCRKHLENGTGRAIVVNSGCANACTGKVGMADAIEMSKLTAKVLDIDADSVFVCSTGTIGKRLQMDKIAHGVKLASKALSRDGADSAKAIMTTDTVEKQVAVEIEIDGKPVRVGGMTKGAGMINPNMATMLCFITTDAKIEQLALQSALSHAVRKSFNSITVDGDESTNDTVIMFANGAAGTAELNAHHSQWNDFTEAVSEVTLRLAQMIVKDGEGATKFVTVNVVGAESDADACEVTRSIANSLLVKTAWFGGDPNWGRIIAAVGYAGVDVDPDQIDITFDDLPAVRNGQMAPEVALADLEAVYAKDSFSVTVNLNAGDGEDTVYTCDCSYDYVKINAEYMT